jgi:hypothetical protein
MDGCGFDEGDWGYRSLMYDTDSGEYIQVEYIFDEDGNVLYHLRMESLDRVNWTMVVEEINWYQEGEPQIYPGVQ